MQTERVWLVILLVVVIIIVTNAFMFAMVRGARGGNDWMKTLQQGNRPWEKEDKGFSELSERVRALKEKDEGGRQKDEG